MSAREALRACLLLLATGCMHTTALTSGGMKVQVLDPGARVANCKALGEVKVNGMHIPSLNNEFRNKVAALGADTVLMQASTDGTARGGNYVSFRAGDAYDCSAAQGTNAATVPQ